MAMTIDEAQIESRKDIGTLGEDVVVEMKTKGGLYVVMVKKATSFAPLAIGPHRAIARYIASQKENGILYTELSKSDYVNPLEYPNLLSTFKALTDQLIEIYSQKNSNV